ncbi:MAG TPA: LysR family transcriptional regulator, partial [Candidatus Sulfotelmatobacter sp.]|nr:LysR family transcriptional regulator [Candidatus Sulfotelmatobacter sp.]
MDKASSSAWDLQRSFLAVVREGSLTGAARSLGLTQPTIGRHVTALEAALGVALFTRSQHGLTPTPAALELLPHAEAMAAAAAAFARTGSGQAEAARGTVRLTASEIVGAEVLPPMLAAFHEKHPAIVLELALTNRNEDLLRRDADIAVRMARPTQTALIARRIGPLRLGLYAHRRYLDRHGMPNTIDELLRHTLIGFDRDTTSMRSVGGAADMLSREMFALRTDNDLAQLAALRAGYGIGGCQEAIAARERELVPVMPGQLHFSLDMWLAMHEDLRTSRRVRLLFDHLAAALAAYVA